MLVIVVRASRLHWVEGIDYGKWLSETIVG